MASSMEKGISLQGIPSNCHTQDIVLEVTSSYLGGGGGGGY